MKDDHCPPRQLTRASPSALNTSMMRIAEPQHADELAEWEIDRIANTPCTLAEREDARVREPQLERGWLAVHVPNQSRERGRGRRRRHHYE
jgi:hypothetical protein